MIERISLVNWKSHRKSEFEFQPGTNVLVGAMGSGKSSVLQAMSFALFGTFAELKHRDIKSADVISRGVEQKVAEIDLAITSQNKAFQIKRKIDEKKNVTEGTVRAGDGKLIAGPQTTQVNDFVKNELGVDDDIFLRTVYAMQNDIDMILKLAPKERKKRIDELMGLNKFEIARNNCVKLRNRTLRQKEDFEAFVQSIGLEGLGKKIKEVENQVDDLKGKQLNFQSESSKKLLERDGARIKLNELRDKFQQAEKLRDRKRSILKDLSELDERLKGKETTMSREELEKEIENLKNQVKITQIKKSELAEKNNDSQIKFMAADKRIALADSRLPEIKKKIDKIMELKKELEEHKIADIANELSKVKKDLDSKKDEKQTNLAELKELRKHLEHLTLARSECPVCGTALSETNKLKLLSQRKQEISQILFKNTEIAEVISQFEKRYEELQSISEKNRRAFEELEVEHDLRGELSKLEQNKSDDQKILAETESVLENNKRQIKSLETEAEGLNAKLSLLNDQKYLNELKEQHSRKSAELELINDDLKTKKVTKEDVGKSEDNFQRLLKQVQELETTISNFETLMTEKTKQLVDLRSQQQKADEIKTKIAELEEKAGFLDRFRVALEATQLALRDELILAVNEVMAQVWVEIYPYEKWSAVRLASTEQDYNLQLKEAEGDWVSVVGFASGGERMLAALAVRIAFARVLAPSLSLLILDEPTHNLDEKAITTFIDVVQHKVSDFLDQIFIVTHEEKLAENADNVIRM